MKKEKRIEFPVAMARGNHLYPYRTQKLSLSALKVLGWKRPGRIGRCRIPRDCAGKVSCAILFFVRKKQANRCGAGRRLSGRVSAASSRALRDRAQSRFGGGCDLHRRIAEVKKAFAKKGSLAQSCGGRVRSSRFGRGCDLCAELPMLTGVVLPNERRLPLWRRKRTISR